MRRSKVGGLSKHRNDIRARCLWQLQCSLDLDADLKDLGVGHGHCYITLKRAVRGYDLGGIAARNFSEGHGLYLAKLPLPPGHPRWRARL